VEFFLECPANRNFKSGLINHLIPIVIGALSFGHATALLTPKLRKLFAHFFKTFILHIHSKRVELVVVVVVVVMKQVTKSVLDCVHYTLAKNERQTTHSNPSFTHYLIIIFQINGFLCLQQQFHHLRCGGRDSSKFVSTLYTKEQQGKGSRHQ
jgi:hypothetical protein